MQREEDYYSLLGVPPDASAEQIKEAYIYKVNILHPDRLERMPERVRHLAEEELKKVNAAHSVLSNPARKRQYDVQQFGRASVASDLEKTRPSGKPQPEVYPKTISFKDVLPLVKQKGIFFVRNVGGSYNKVLLGKTPEWVKVVQTKSLQSRSKLPMRVDIEAVGIQWGKVYSGQIAVRLDNVETHVKIELRTSKKRRKFFS